MSWKREKEEEGQVVGVEEVAVVVAPRHQAQAQAQAQELAQELAQALALDRHRGARGLGQEVEVEAAAEVEAVEAVDAQCKPENHALPPRIIFVLISLTTRFLHTEVLHMGVANTMAEALQQPTDPEADHQVELYPLPLAAAFSVLH